MGEPVGWLALPGVSHYLLAGLVTMVQETVAMLLVAWRLPHRSRFGARMALVAAVTVAGTTLATWVGRVVVPELMGSLYYRTMICMLLVSVAVSVPLTLWLFDASLWTALTCVALGCTLQSLVSGIEGLWGLSEWSCGLAETPVLAGVWPRLLVAAVVFCAFYLLFVRRVRRGRMLDAGGPSVAVLAAITMLVVAAFDIVNMRLPGLRAPVSLVVTLRFVHGFVCVFMLAMGYELLYNRWLRFDVAAMRRMGEDERQQFELARNQTRFLEGVLDDLRRRVLDSAASGTLDRAALAELSREVAVYDAAVRTGNDALDTILTEKSLACEAEGIRLGCVADGSAVSFMDPADLYWLFDSLLENAMEAARGAGEEDKRTIDLTVRRVGDMAQCHVENYFGGGVRIVDGRPVGGGSHAYGLGARAVTQVAASYGGSATFSLEGDTFRADVLLPLPEGRGA